MASPSGDGSGVKVVGLREFRSDLKAIGPEWGKALADVHRQIGRRGAAVSQARARGMGGIFAEAASAIVGKGNQRDARVGVSQTKTNPMANVAFWGAKRRTGWYARQRRDGNRQHPPWVGNTWEPAVAGQGPYAINDALAAQLPDILDQYGRMIDRLAAKAYPDSGDSGAIGAGVVRAPR